MDRRSFITWSAQGGPLLIAESGLSASYVNVQFVVLHSGGGSADGSAVGHRALLHPEQGVPTACIPLDCRRCCIV